MKGNIKIAYWDTEKSGRPPRLLGEIKGTPTIRMFQPKRKQSNPLTSSQKVVTDYQYERTAKDMKRWIDGQMMHYVELVANGEGDLEKYLNKADKHALPKAMLFASKPTVSAMTKFLSVEFRRRLLLAQVQPTKKNKDIMERYGVDAENLPVLIVIPPGAQEPIFYDGNNGFQRGKLERFLSSHALENPVIPVPKEEKPAEEAPKKESEKKESVKVEL